MSRAHGHTSLDLDRRPLLVFWETTRSCLLACRHCRASAIREPLPGELTTGQAERFVDSLTAFGRPYPVLILTGGDVMMRPDLLPLVRRARALGLPVAVSPSVTPCLTRDAVRALRDAGVKAASISLDGATAATHEGVRGVEGHFEQTLAAIRLLREEGFVVQVNTVVMRENANELADVAAIVKELGAAIWEVFFLVRVGRATAMTELSPAENEDVCDFLYDASRHGFVVRTVEAPFFRRVVATRRAGGPPAGGALYERLALRLRRLAGEGTGDPKAQTKGTRDGKGIVFVAHDGDVYPAGFLPVPLGNVVRDDLAELYRRHPLLRSIRAARFGGRCGTCEYADLCGGSRARAYASSGDPLGEDPACPYVPRRERKHMKARLALVSVLVAAVAAGLSLPVSAAFRSGAATVLKIKADKIALKYNVSKLKAEAGKVTIVMSNPSPLLHDVAIKGVKKKGKTVGKGGVSKLTVTLKPGKYTFYCTVPGHAAAGMKGTLTVE